MLTETSVKAVMNYTVDNGVPPNHYFYEPEPSEGVVANPAGTDPRDVQIHDGWGNADNYDLDAEGFAIKPFPRAFTNFNDNDAVMSEFYKLVVEFVKAETGAKRVEVFDHTLRRRMPEDSKEQNTLERPAVQLVHCDYTEKSGPQRVQDLFPGEANRLLSGRVAFYNVWKPLYARVEELPLAVCDVKSNRPGDLLNMDLKYRERDGEVYVMRYSPEHRWVYFPLMEPTHAMMLKTYDSETDGRARFMAHSAFEDPNTPAGAKPRESIEVRTMAFF